MENTHSANAPVEAPIQYSEGGRKLKEFLHTPIGAAIGFAAGIQGFNALKAEHFRFKRFAFPGEDLKRGETIRPVGDTGRYGVYAAPAVSRAFNSRVNKGGDLTASLLSGTSFNSITSPLPPKYIALSTSSLTPAAGDTTLAGETSVAGLARALGTQGSYTAPVALDGACSYVVSKTFTLTGGATTVVSTALFDAASTGNLFVEANFSSSAVMATNDQLAVNWTINL